MKRVVVGCPVYKRAQALSKWGEAVAAQEGYQIIPAFVVTHGKDDKTMQVIDRMRDRFTHVLVHDFGSEEEWEDHNWTSEDKAMVMANKRNHLLDLAIGADPDYFLSLDSDTIIPKGGLGALEKVLLGGPYHAVSPRVWIWDGAIACANYVKGVLSMVSRKSFGTMPVDVPSMSACLMKKDLFTDKRVRFGVFIAGKHFSWDPDHTVDGWTASEVFAWASAAKKRGYKCALINKLTFPHEMK